MGVCPNSPFFPPSKLQSSGAPCNVSHIACTVTTQIRETYGGLHNTYNTQGHGGKYFFEKLCSPAGNRLFPWQKTLICQAFLYILIHFEVLLQLLYPFEKNILILCFF